MINSSLLEGGIVIGSHEPNKQVFNNKLFCWAAALYKRFGGSININYEMVRKFNEILRSRYPDAPEVCREEILQVVEYQSPLEQYEKDIQIRSGFLPDEFFKSCFPGYRTVEFQTYSTFYHRPWLSRHRILQYSLHSLFEVLFPGGNLFRFVLQKVKS